MYSKLNYPGVIVDMKFYLGTIYSKLPVNIQRMVKKTVAKDYSKLRNAVLEVETSPTF